MLRQELKLMFTNSYRYVDLDELADSIIQILEKYYRRHNNKLGFVAGLVPSNGQVPIPINSAKSEKDCNYLEARYNMPVFAAANLYDSDALEYLMRNNYNGLMGFWKKIYTCGYITDTWVNPHGETIVLLKDRANYRTI